MYLQNIEEINKILSDMYSIFCHLPIEAQELFTQKTHELMLQRNNTSLYALQVFKEFHEKALQYRLNINNISVLEMGAGKPLGSGIFWNFAGVKKYTSIDKFTQVNLNDLWLSRFKTILNMNILNMEDSKTDSLFKKNGNHYALNTERIKFIHGSFEEYPLEKKSFDFIYSTAVLEHVTNIEKIMKKMHDVLSDDGIMIHNIDLREHHTHLRTVPDKNTSTDFLKYSTEEWIKIYPPGSLHYINRLRANDFRKYFEDAGFNIIEFTATQEMELNKTVYPAIHPEFHKYSIADLKKLVISVVLEKA